MATTQNASFSKLVTTDTTANSLVVGGATPSATTGTGGIKCGPIVNTTLTASGAIIGSTTLAMTGVSTFSDNIQLATTKKLSFDSGTNGTYWTAPTANDLRAFVNTTQVAQMTAAAITLTPAVTLTNGFISSAPSTVTGSGSATAFTVASTTTSNVLQTFQNASTGVLAQIVGTNALGMQLLVNAGNTFGIEIDSSAQLRLRGYGAGTLTTDGSGNVTAVSDERAKDIIGRFDEGLDAVLSMDPIRYHYNAESGLDPVGIYAGFSAQNVQAVIPEAVGVDPRGYLSLNTTPIIAALVNAVKALQAQLDQLRQDAGL